MSLSTPQVKIIFVACMMPCGVRFLQSRELYHIRLDLFCSAASARDSAALSKSQRTSCLHDSEDVVLRSRAQYEASRNARPSRIVSREWLSRNRRNNSRAFFPCCKVCLRLELSVHLVQRKVKSTHSICIFLMTCWE